jgi:hypothetical protein
MTPSKMQSSQPFGARQGHGPVQPGMTRIIHQYRRPAQVNAYCAGTSVTSRCWFRRAGCVGTKSCLRRSGSLCDLGPAYMNNPGMMLSSCQYDPKITSVRRFQGLTIRSLCVALGGRSTFKNHSGSFDVVCNRVPSGSSHLKPSTKQAYEIPTLAIGSSIHFCSITEFDRGRT